MNFDDPLYLEFVLDCEKDCRCCRQCQIDIPCAAVLAGGLCDKMCICEDCPECGAPDDQCFCWESDRRHAP